MRFQRSKPTTFYFTGALPIDKAISEKEGMQ